MILNRFSPERLYHIRRLRKARRYFKQTPLFAFGRMVEEYPGYSFELFMDDLRRRTKPKKRKGRNPLIRYGRYWRIEKLQQQFRNTKNFDLIVKANKLRQNITKPYRVKYQIGKESTEYIFSALIPIEHIEKLVADLSTCTTAQQAEELIEKFNKYPIF